jgi:hypothetical protein
MAHPAAASFVMARPASWWAWSGPASPSAFQRAAPRMMPVEATSTSLPARAQTPAASRSPTAPSAGSRRLARGRPVAATMVGVCCSRERRARHPAHVPTDPASRPPVAAACAALAPAPRRTCVPPMAAAAFPPSLAPKAGAARVPCTRAAWMECGERSPTAAGWAAATSSTAVDVPPAKRASPTPPAAREPAWPRRRATGSVARGLAIPAASVARPRAPSA